MRMPIFAAGILTALLLSACSGEPRLDERSPAGVDEAPRGEARAAQTTEALCFRRSRMSATIERHESDGTDRTRSSNVPWTTRSGSMIV